MRRILTILIILLMTISTQAVLKEKDLSQTLSVLRAELEQAYNEQQVMMNRFDQRNSAQHARLVRMMQNSNQIALMLYSQNTDFTFDVAYACQAATEQYHNINRYHAPYDKMKERIKADIDRYDALIKTLQNLPPRMLPNGDIAQLPDSIRKMIPKMVLDTAAKNIFILDEQGLADREDCVDYAFQHRKDILVDAYTVEQKELAVKAAKAGYLPSVNLNAGPSLNFELRPGSSRTPGISAGVSASWNIFDSGVTKAQVDSAKTDLEVAQLTLDRDRENVDLALRQAYFTMRAAEDQLRSTRDAVGQAEEDYYIAREKYRAGEGIMLDVLDAQKALSEARLQHIQAQYDYVTGKAAVENAMGISLTDREQAAAEQLSLKVVLPSDVAQNAQLLKQSFEEEKRQRAKAKEQFSEQVEKDLERVTQETSSHPAVRSGEEERTVRPQEAALAADEAAGQRKEIAE